MIEVRSRQEAKRIMISNFVPARIDSRTLYLSVNTTSCLSGLLNCHDVAEANRPSHQVLVNHLTPMLLEELFVLLVTDDLFFLEQLGKQAAANLFPRSGCP